MRALSATPCLLALAIGLLPAAAARAQMSPGLLVDPPGLEMFVNATYNSARDEYFITYAGDEAHGLRLSPCGEILEEVSFFDDPAPNSVSQVAVTYNPDRDEYLAVVRLAEPQNLFVRYLDTWGVPLSEPIPIVELPERGGGPSVHYAPVAERYLVRWGRGNQHSSYRMVAGDSGSPEPLIGDRLELHANGFSSQASYGAGSDRFLTSFTVGGNGEVDADVLGRFISGDGATAGPVFELAVGPRAQQGSILAYASSTDRWLVALQDWSRFEQGHVADVLALLVDPEGTVRQRFYLIETGDDGWDVAGPMAYHPTAHLFFATWFLLDTTYYRTVDPATGALGPIETVAGEDAAPTAIAVRPHSLNPQVLFIWRKRFNGVYAGLLNIAGECTDEVPADDDVEDAGADPPPDEPDVRDVGSDEELGAGAEIVVDPSAEGDPGEPSETELGEDGALSSTRLEGGCGCRADGSSPAPGVLVLVLVLLLWRATDRRARARHVGECSATAVRT